MPFVPLASSVSAIRPIEDYVNSTLVEQFAAADDPLPVAFHFSDGAVMLYDDHVEIRRTQDPDATLDGAIDRQFDTSRGTWIPSLQQGFVDTDEGKSAVTPHCFMWNFRPC